MQGTAIEICSSWMLTWYFIELLREILYPGGQRSNVRISDTAASLEPAALQCLPQGHSSRAECLEMLEFWTLIYELKGLLPSHFATRLPRTDVQCYCTAFWKCYDPVQPHSLFRDEPTRHPQRFMKCLCKMCQVPSVDVWRVPVLVIKCSFGLNTFWRNCILPARL